MKRATKENIALFVLGMIFALGFVTVVFQVGTYVVNQAGFLTPYVIYAWGFGMMIGAGIGILILQIKKKSKK